MCFFLPSFAPNILNTYFFMKYLFIIGSSLFTANLSIAQDVWDGSTTPTISTTGSVGIGGTNVSYRLNVYNTTGTVPSGIYNTLNIVHSGVQYGLRNDITMNGTGTKHGIYNSMSTSTASSSYGLYNLLGGSGTGTRYGISSTISGTGTGTRYGGYFIVNGTETMLKYGLYSQVTNAGLNNSSTDATAFGIYALGTGANSRAGYFRGDVEINRANLIYSSANGMKTMLFQHAGAGDYSFSLVTNQTDNAYDWNWGKALMMTRDGHLVKKTNSTTLALSVNRQDLSADVFRVYGDGKVYCTEMNVMLSGSFPDYVFKPSYALMPLSQVGEFISKNGHLPNVPDAQTVAAEGINVGEMTKVMVEKIEELTLYILEQQKQLEAMKACIAELEAQH